MSPSYAHANETLKLLKGHTIASKLLTRIHNGMRVRPLAMSQKSLGYYCKKKNCVSTIDCSSTSTMSQLMTIK